MTFIVSLLKCTFDYSILTTNTIDTDFGIIAESWGNPAKLFMMNIFTFFLNLSNRSFRQVGFYLFIYLENYVQFIIIEWSTGIAVFAAATFAFHQVTDKLFLYDIITHQNIINYNHAKKFQAKLSFLQTKWDTTNGSSLVCNFDV